MALFMIAFFGAMLLFSLYFQQVRAESAFNAGLLVAPLGIVVIAGSMVVFTRLSDTTSYWTIGVALLVVGLGMGMVGMPNMSIALKTLRPYDIARASTSLTIIQQAAASIGTAMLSVILFNEVKDQVATQAQSIANAYASTFLWALVLLTLSLIPALVRLRSESTPDAGSKELRVPEPVGTTVTTHTRGSG